MSAVSAGAGAVGEWFLTRQAARLLCWAETAIGVAAMLSLRVSPGGNITWQGAVEQFLGLMVVALAVRFPNLAAGAGIALLIGSYWWHGWLVFGLSTMIYLAIFSLFRLGRTRAGLVLYGFSVLSLLGYQLHRMWKGSWVGGLFGEILVISIIAFVGFFLNRTFTNWRLAELARAEAEQGRLRLRKTMIAELHDSLGRSIAELAAEIATVAENSSGDFSRVQELLSVVEHDLSQALSQTDGNRDLAEIPELLDILQDRCAWLRQRGFVPELVIVDEPLASVPDELLRSLVSILGEGFENIRRYATPGSPVRISVAVTLDGCDLVLVNEVPIRENLIFGHGLGLGLARERVEFWRGELQTSATEELFVFSVAIPAPFVPVTSGPVLRSREG